MPKYCSICLAEFKDKLEVCPKDGITLSEKKPKAYERLVDIYAASSEIEAEHIVTFLKTENIIAKMTITGISQVPVASDTRFIISVLKESRKEAKDLLEEARSDGIISQDGNFL